MAHSALYLKNKLLASNEYLWLTRVPETIEEAKYLVMKPDELIEWKSLSDGYKAESHVSNYGNIEQRWLLVYSEKAYQKKKNWAKMEMHLQRKGRFILATNELNLNQYSDEQVLREFKEQQNVERGFRFLKDPWFMVDSIF